MKNAYFFNIFFYCNFFSFFFFFDWLFSFFSKLVLLLGAFLSPQPLNLNKRFCVCVCVQDWPQFSGAPLLVRGVLLMCNFRRIVEEASSSLAVSEREPWAWNTSYKIIWKASLVRGVSLSLTHTHTHTHCVQTQWKQNSASQQLLHVTGVSLRWLPLSFLGV